MKTFDFIQMTISHNLKDPHPKALEPDCLSPFLAVATQSLSRGFSHSLKPSSNSLLEKIDTIDLDPQQLRNPELRIDPF